MLLFKLLWNAGGSGQPKDMHLPCVYDLRLSDRPAPTDLGAWISLKDRKCWCPSAWVHTAMSFMPLAPAETVSARNFASGRQISWGKHCQARGSSRHWIPCCCWFSACRSGRFAAERFTFWPCKKLLKCAALPAAVIPLFDLPHLDKGRHVLCVSAPCTLWAAFRYLGILSLATGKVCRNKLHDRVINYRESRANLGSRSQLLERWELWQTHEERGKGRLIFKRKAEILLLDFVPLKWDHFWPWFLWEQAQSPNFCLMFFFLSQLSGKNWCFKTIGNSSFFIKNPKWKP